MEYKVIRTCHGFKGRYWEEGQVVDLEDHETPPKHFVPLSEYVPMVKITHRTEPQNMHPGRNREVFGGYAETVKKDVLPRILTTDRVPNNAPKPLLPRGKKKGVGSVKK